MNPATQHVENKPRPWDAKRHSLLHLAVCAVLGALYGAMLGAWLDLKGLDLVVPGAAIGLILGAQFNPEPHDQG